jgi:dTDP-4-amino-4,6-dideoxygalactose transaminase
MTTTTEELPAFAGGKPAKTKPFSKQKRYGDEELEQLKEALAQGTLFYAQGKKVKTLEEQFAKHHGAKHAVACSSGTAAIHSAMMAAGISPGDEVIVPPITDMGSIVPILFQGAVPVFCDLDPNSYLMTPATIEKRITPKTRAVLAVHLWGNACDLGAITKLCDDRKLTLIEDCAQAFGCKYDGKCVGNFGAMGCYSYNEFKHISSGDGGMIITNDDALAKKLRLATDKCYDRSPNAKMRQATFLAANYRMTELQGAVAIAQLAKLDSIVSRRQKWCAKLSEQINGLPGITLPKVTDKCDPSWWFYMIRVEPDVLGATADEFTQAMHKEGVPMGAHYIGEPIYAYPLFENHSAFDHAEHPFKSQSYKMGDCPEAEAILKTCCMLPINEGYTEDDLNDTVRAFNKVVNYLHQKRGLKG